MHTVETQLFDEEGFRKFIDRHEFREIRDATWRLAPLPRAFCQLIAMTGCRISEALGLCGHQVTSDGVVLRTLKRRSVIHRLIYIPSWLTKQLRLLVAGLASISDRVFNVSRRTATRWVDLAMRLAHVEGKHATARGMRHAFGSRAAMDGLPGHMVQYLLGHRYHRTTEIYLHTFLGDQAKAILARTWT